MQTALEPRHDQCRVLMVYPRFNPNSFWNYQATCEMTGAKYPAPPLGLITVASLLPKSWEVRLVNANTAPLLDADLDWADVVMTGGMLPQKLDCLEVIARAQTRGKSVVVGGPDATSSPQDYARADFLVLGEAEGVLDRFVSAWRAGVRNGRFEAEKFKADVTTTPVPRFDLLRFRDYLHVGVQFSRGCPFTCEFCDIIELYGRVPRTKTTPQMLAELDALFDTGYRGHVDFVDDNLIGNKKAVKLFLPRLIDWQRSRGYPFEFSTEASVNLADDEDLLEMLRDAGFFAIFMGIESPSEETLRTASKKQNTHRSLVDDIRKLYRFGIFAVGGFIVGFDGECGSVAAPMSELIESSAMPVAMVGLLFALPNTQLVRRLQREGRLFEPYVPNVVDGDEVFGDQCTAGLNFTTQRPRRDALHDYREVLACIYSPAAYFGRVRNVARELRPMARPPAAAFRAVMRDVPKFVRLAWGVTHSRSDMRGEFWRSLGFAVVCNPAAIVAVVRLAALYLHLGPFSRYVISRIDAQIVDLDAGRWVQPALLVSTQTGSSLAHVASPVAKASGI